MKQAILILGIFTAVFFTVGDKAHTNASGAPAGSTGSPGDGGAGCTGYCHSGPSVSDEQILISDAEWGGVFAITVESKSSTAFQYSKAGFQACVEDGEGNKIGEVSLIDFNKTKIVDIDYVTHTTAGTAPSEMVFNSHHQWVFNWTPPAEYSGEATVYATSMLTNANGNNQGDVFVSNSHTFMVGVGIDEVNDFEFTAFPNPTTEQITLQWKESPGENANIYLCDAKGAISTLIKGDLNQNEYTFSIPSHLARGLYSLNVSSKKGQSSKRIVLQ
jgi:hypothetical protein